MLHHNYNLKHHNTFALEISTDYFLEIEEVGDYLSYLKDSDILTQKTLILGGGSNLLFLNNYKGLVIHPTKKEINIVQQNDNFAFVEVTAAVEWDDFVEWSVNENLGGIENLTDIPGNIGASPVQNIGAYGIEAKDTIELVKGFYLNNGETFEMDNAACQFKYRDSIFKGELKNKVVITSVMYKLNKVPSFQLSYGNLKEKVENLGGCSLQNIRKAVREIRASKLPNVKEYGNAGSFFKNPVITASLYKNLQNKYANIPGYTAENTSIKIPAAWLIDQCGLKGKKQGGAQVFTKQPLVIINTGSATGEDIYNLAQYVIKSVFEKFNITLQAEVNIIS